MDEVTRIALELAWREGYYEGWMDEASGLNYDEETENPYKRKKVVEHDPQDQQD